MSQNILNLKQKDDDLYLAALFAPKQIREQIYAAFSMFSEISEIPAKVSEPMVAKIKLQWWRDVITEIIEGKPSRPHPALVVLQDNKAALTQFLSIIDEYYKLADGWQPRTMDEITEFLQKTIAQVLDGGKLGLAYGYVQLAKKLAQNSKFHARFATDPALLIGQLVEKAKALEYNKKSAFGIIIDTYIKTLPKQPNRFFMLCKLGFSAKTMI